MRIRYDSEGVEFTRYNLLLQTYESYRVIKFRIIHNTYNDSFSYSLGEI